MAWFCQPLVRSSPESRQHRGSVDHGSVWSDLSKRFESKCMELTCHPADLTLACLTCCALKARVTAPSRSSLRAPSRRDTPRATAGGSCPQPRHRMSGLMFGCAPVAQWRPLRLEMTVGSFSRHLQLDDQPQRRLLRCDGSDDIVLATNMPVIHTYNCAGANNVTHDFNDSRLGRQGWSSGSKRQVHQS